MKDQASRQSSRRERRWIPAEPAAALSDWTLHALERGRAVALGARARRIAFGAALLAGTGALVLRSLLADIVDLWVFPRAWEIVLITWLLALLSAACAAPLTRLMAPFVAKTPPRMTHDDETLLASLVLPAAGLALFLPVSLHMPVVLAAAGADVFDLWCTRSLALVAHAHVVLAVLAAHRAAVSVERMGNTRRGSASEPGMGGEEPAGSPVAIYVVTILVSAVPFGVAYVAPPLLLALTGLPVLALAALAGPMLAREASLLRVNPGAAPPPAPPRARRCAQA